MDYVASTNETAVPLILEPTIQAFMKLLEPKREQIQSYPKKTFQYGSIERQSLDVYYPEVKSDSTSKPPFLFFIYGGFFVSGNKVYPPPNDLGYTNAGVFYAKQGFVTIIPDYRLAPSIKFPEPVEDIRDALVYAVQNITEGDPDKIFLLGHSAGACHTISLFLAQPSILQSTTLQPRIKGIILLGGVYNLSSSYGLCPPEIATMYYGSPELAGENCPFNLLEKASQDVLNGIPNSVFFVVSQKDPALVIQNSHEFAAALEKKLGREIKKSVAKGHNHISVNWALLTGEGQEWAVEVAGWIQQTAGS